MNAPNSPLSNAHAPPAFLCNGFELLHQAQANAAPLYSALEELETLAGDGSRKKIRSLRRALATVTPSVTMIGQIKAGKTSLINAMIGQPDLLPADVNPWTSVVTTLHLQPNRPDPPTSATFDFFDDGEWDRLVKMGGRLGELADRAGSEIEVAKVKQQIEDMRSKSKQRLGQKFELLMGQTHRYGYFDAELIERYVCLGDDFATDTANDAQTGRFADITKSAALYMQASHIPHLLDIRDTPGINDTFMMREQITLQSIRDSRICVVVLSAHQALSSDDMALVRLISNAASREVIIFVNRIDELSRPLEEVPQIERSLLETLNKYGVPRDIDVVFGSAIWALSAIQDRVESLPEASKSALLNWAQSNENRPTSGQAPRDMLFSLSGLPRLHEKLCERMVAGTIGENTKRVTKQAQNIAAGIRAQENLIAVSKIGRRRVQQSAGQLQSQITELHQSCIAQFENAQAEVVAAFENRIARAAEGFVARATDALVNHLDKHGEKEPWQYDPTGLRLLLSSAFRSFERNYLQVFQDAAAQGADALTHIARKTLNLPADALVISPPDPVRIPPPIVIGQTIALDLSGNWWRSWWQKRRGHHAFADNFRKLIEQEINPILITLSDSTKTHVCGASVKLLDEFFNDQHMIWSNVAGKLELSDEDIAKLLKLDELKSRDTALRKIEQSLGVGE